MGAILAALTSYNIYFNIWKVVKTIGGVVLKHWREALIAILIILADHYHQSAVSWHQKASACQSERRADKEAFISAARAAEAKNKKEVKDTEDKWKGVVKQTEENYDNKLKAAYASVSAYASRLRNDAAGSKTGTVQLSETTEPAEGTDGPGEGAVVPVGSDGPGEGGLIPVPIGDLNVCAENTVRAQTWLQFWNSIAANQPGESNDPD